MQDYLCVPGIRCPREARPPLPTAAHEPWIITPSDSGRSYQITIQYCLSQKVQESCQLQFSATILYVVIGCNIIKLTCLLSTLYRMNTPTLVTVGDAIGNFLQQPDDLTRGICTASKSSIQIQKRMDSTGPQRWDHRSYRWFTSASSLRWLFCYGL